MKHTVNFYLDKNSRKKGENIPVYLFVSFGGKRLKYYTGERCKINQWADKTADGDKIQRVKRNVITSDNETGANINRRLDKLETEVGKWFTSCGEKDITPDRNNLKKHLDSFMNKKQVKEINEVSFFDRYKQYRENSNFSEGRKRHLKVSSGKIKKYYPHTTFDSITPEFLVGYRNYLSTQGLGKNTIASQLKYIRSFITYANKMGWTENNPFNKFSIESESYSDPVYITLAERDMLYDAKIEKEYLQRVRDIFVFQCMIGCRVGDLLKLRKSNIVDGCVEYIAGKTKDNHPKVARIPLTEKAKSILDKYDLTGDRILPFISSQKYNKYIKELFVATKLTRMVTIRDPKTGLDIQKPINEIASSHMARRVFVGGLHGKGVKNEVIASMSGHSPNSRSFNRYYSIEKENQINAIKEIE
nr:site-specific integrase [uncultured Draconibacterium sp.]